MMMVYITASSKKEAAFIAEVLLDEHLIACANIIPGIESWYWWKGKMQKSTEAVVIAKTQKKFSKKIIRHIKSIHSYETPCILFYDIKGGNPDFIKWIKQNTSATKI